MSEKPPQTQTTLAIGWRTWLALGVTVTLSLTFALTFAGILVVGLGLPLAWRIDRASYSWAEQTEAAPEGPGW